MQKLFFIFIFFVTAAVFSCIMPYPVLSNHTNITEADAFEINNVHESEISSKADQQTRLLDLDFEFVDVLLPIGEQFEIVDLESEISFLATRTGGKNHADIEPSDSENASNLTEIGEFSWARRPVLVRLNDYAYLPASLAAYPHGYNSIENGIFGHLCLHFNGSKTDGTKEEDFRHQQAIKTAREMGKKYLEKL